MEDRGLALSGPHRLEGVAWRKQMHWHPSFGPDFMSGPHPPFVFFSYQ